MKLQNDVRKFLTGKKIEFALMKSFKNIEFTIKIPDLTQNSFTVSGDWGPVYVFNIDPKNLIHMTVSQDSQKQEYFLENRVITFASPMLEKERKAYPFFIEFSDDRQRLKYNIFLDIQGEAKRVVLLDQNGSIISDVDLGRT